MSRPGPAATLLVRHLATGRATSLLLAVLVLVLAGLASAWPRASEHMFTADLRAQVSGALPIQRDVNGTVPIHLDWPGASTADVDEVYGHLEETLRAVRADADPGVATFVGEPEYQLSVEPVMVDGAPSHYGRGTLLSLATTRSYADRIRLVEGDRPAPPRRGAIDVLLAAEVAGRYQWQVGEHRELATSGPTIGTGSVLPPGAAGPSGSVRVRLAGIFEPVDASDPYWDWFRPLLEPAENLDGDGNVQAGVRGLVHPLALTRAQLVGDHEARVWYPLTDPDGLTAAGAAEAEAALRAFAGAAVPIELVRGQYDPEPAPTLRLRTRTLEVLDSVVAQHRTATALLAVVVSGPLGLALVVLGLAGRLVVVRRRGALALLGARGGAPRQLRGLLAVEGLLLGVPAAAAGILLADLLVAGVPGRTGLLLPAVLGLAPAFLLPWAARERSALQPGRADLGRRTRRAWLRWTAEACVIGTAVVAAVLLRTGGLDGDGGGTDPVVVAAPILLAAAVAILVVRLYPLPVRALVRLCRDRPGLVAFVGSVRALRDPAGGVLPVLALVIGLAVALFSATLWTTTESAGASQSVNAIGADLRVDGAVLREPEVAQLADVDGVEAVAELAVQGRRDLVLGDEVVPVAFHVGDTDAMREVQQPLDGVAVVPDGLAAPVDGALPVAVEEGLARPGQTGLLGPGEIPVVVVAALPRVAGVQDDAWVLADFAAAERLDVRHRRVGAAVLLRGGAIDSERVQALVGETGSLSTSDDVLSEVRSGPVGRGMVAAFGVAVAVAVLLSGAALLLSLEIAAPARRRLLSQLRTQGLSLRQAQAITAWELGPLSVAAVVGGLGLGMLVSWLFIGAIDLRPLTGSAEPPEAAYDVGLLAGAVLAFAAVLGLAVVAAVAAGRRAQLGDVLRVGEES